MPDERSLQDVAKLGDLQTTFNGAAAACVGAITTVAAWKITKVGRIVTLHLPGVTGIAIAAASFDFGTLIPAEYRPSASVGVPVVVKDNTANLAAPGLAFITAAGLITIFKTLLATGNFTAAATAGLAYDCSVSWCV